MLWFHFGKHWDINSNTFIGLSNLEELYLSDNQLATLELTAFEMLSMLTELDLRSNRINSLNKELLQNLKNLKYLGLKYNRLKEIKINSLK